jgi:hypothetical protein
MAYGLCQRAVASLTNTPDVTSLNALQNATSGFCAAFFSSLVLCPTELIKCKLQAMHEMNAGKAVTHRMYALHFQCNYVLSLMLHFFFLIFPQPTDESEINSNSA